MFIVVCCKVHEYASNLKLVSNYVLTFEFVCISLLSLCILVDAYPIVLFMDYEMARQIMNDYLNYDTEYGTASSSL